LLLHVSISTARVDEIGFEVGDAGLKVVESRVGSGLRREWRGNGVSMRAVSGIPQRGWTF
jgi:hypothetical protein